MRTSPSLEAQVRALIYALREKSEGETTFEDDVQTALPYFNQAQDDAIASQSSELTQLKSQLAMAMDAAAKGDKARDVADALTQELAQARLQVQVLREAHNKFCYNEFQNLFDYLCYQYPATSGDLLLADFCKAVCVTLTTTPTLADYVERSVADNLHVAMSRLLEAFQNCHSPLNITAYEREAKEALAAYESTKPKQ
jgi:hypothetical protein